MTLLRRILFEVRWAVWFLGADWPTWMYRGQYARSLNEASRKIILDRMMDEWLAREPKFSAER